MTMKSMVIQSDASNQLPNKKKKRRKKKRKKKRRRKKSLKSSK